MKLKKILSSLVVLSIIATSSLALGANVKAAGVNNQSTVNIKDSQSKPTNTKKTSTVSISGNTDYWSDHMPVLSIGSSGDYVGRFQTALNIYRNGANLPLITASGYFGTQTQQAVKSFQMDMGLTQDGIVGSQTWYAIEPIYKSMN